MNDHHQTARLVGAPIWHRIVCNCPEVPVEPVAPVSTTTQNKILQLYN